MSRFHDMEQWKWSVDFGTQNAEFTTGHYLQPGKEGSQKMNTVGILYHSKWHNILAVSRILETITNQ